MMPSPDPTRSRPAENHRTATSGLGGQTLGANLTPATDSGHEAAPLTADGAERLTARIRLRLDTIADNAEQVVPLIEQAKAGDAHQALGYPSWIAYVSERFRGTLGRLDRSTRQPLVLL
ncbi:MAG: hypothetical protein M3500_11060, partial [Actinomycetota bacterium]|nr:hypothetical protein [Actinomycetota bacterium]